LSTHYRSPLDFSDERLSEAQRSLERLRTAVENSNELGKMPNSAVDTGTNELQALATKARQDFYSAMDDDFNTALAIGVMFGLAKEINVYYSAVVAGREKYNMESYSAMRDVYFMMADVLGILVQERLDKLDGSQELIGQLMDIIIDIRQDARQSKNWAIADKVRDSLGAVGIILEDSSQGVRWKKR